MIRLIIVLVCDEVLSIDLFLGCRHISISHHSISLLALAIQLFPIVQFNQALLINRLLLHHPRSLIYLGQLHLIQLSFILVNRLFLKLSLLNLAQ